MCPREKAYGKVEPPEPLSRGPAGRLLALAGPRSLACAGFARPRLLALAGFARPRLLVLAGVRDPRLLALAGLERSARCAPVLDKEGVVAFGSLFVVPPESPEPSRSTSDLRSPPSAQEARSHRPDLGGGSAVQVAAGGSFSQAIVRLRAARDAARWLYVSGRRSSQSVAW